MQINYFNPRYQKTARKNISKNLKSIKQDEKIISSKDSNKMLICIFNYMHDNNAKRWLNILSPYFDTVVLDSGSMHKEPLFIQYPNIYYSGLWNEMKKLFEKGNYSWAGIITSDVKIDDENAQKLISELKHLQQAKNIGCWTVLGDLSGHSNRYVYAQYNGKYYRTFEGFFLFMNKKVLNEQPYVNTNINLYGYGLDFLSCYISNKNGLANIVNEDIKIFHPKDKGYNGNDAAQQSNNYQKYLQKLYPGYQVSAKEFSHIMREYEIEPYYFQNEKIKKCIYTCISGNYDSLKEPLFKTDGWDYICFTDQNLTSNIWNIRKIPEDLTQYSQVKKQRLLKILSYKYLSDYDTVIWADANQIINGNLDDFINETLKTNNVAFKDHPYRNCIYDECDACVQWNKETKTIADALKERYNKEGMPTHYGLFETSVFCRNNKSAINKKLSDMWAKELIENSHRDQLSLNYCIWKLNIKNNIDNFSQNVYFKYFKYTNHK